MSFELLGLAPETMRAIEDAGYSEPTPIQKQAIPSVLMGRDVMGIAQTGTGKTAGFTLPMIDILAQGRARARMPRSLILEPTRELAAQVAESFETYGKYHKLTMALLIGGVSFDDQLKKLDRGVDVLIATPGRLLDHFERGGLMLNGVDILVIDEADRMLDMGFIPDVEKICSLMPQKHQTLFFSATMPKEIKRLADRFLNDPKQIEVARPSSTAENVEQFSCFIPSTDPASKRDKLRQILRGEDLKNAIVFCNRKRDVDIVYKSLKSHGFNAAALHGDMDQSSRMDVLAGFKNNDIQLLVASDVAARGLDIPAVSHVFNYDVPTHAEDYVHRIGRTGRAGRSGRAFTLVTKIDTKYLHNVQSLIGKEIPAAPGEKDPNAGGGAAPKADSQNGEQQSGEKKPRSRRGGRSRSNKGQSDNNQTASTQSSGDESGQKQSRSRTKGQNADNGGSGNRQSKSNGSGRNNQQNKSGNSRRGRNRKQNDDHGDAVVGMGDHMPAFLEQSIGSDTGETKSKPKRSRSKKTEAA